MPAGGALESRRSPPAQLRGEQNQKAQLQILASGARSLAFPHALAGDGPAWPLLCHANAQQKERFKVDCKSSGKQSTDNIQKKAQLPMEFRLAKSAADTNLSLDLHKERLLTLKRPANICHQAQACQEKKATFDQNKNLDGCEDATIKVLILLEFQFPRVEA